MPPVYTHRQPQKDNTCEGCNKLICEYDENSHEVNTCHTFPCMEPESPGYMVRCIQYDDVPQLNWKNGR